MVCAALLSSHNPAAAQNLFALIKDSQLPGGDIPQRFFKAHRRAAFRLGRDHSPSGSRAKPDFHFRLEWLRRRGARNPVHACHAQGFTAQFLSRADNQTVVFDVFFPDIERLRRGRQALALTNRIKGKPVVLPEQLASAVGNWSRLDCLRRVFRQKVPVIPAPQKTQVLAFRLVGRGQAAFAGNLADLSLAQLS